MLEYDRGRGVDDDDIGIEEDIATTFNAPQSSLISRTSGGPGHVRGSGSSGGTSRSGYKPLSADDLTLSDDESALSTTAQLVPNSTATAMRAAAVSREAEFMRSSILVYVVNFFLWAATLIIPAIYNEIQKDFNLGPRHLAAVPLVRGLVQYLLAPLFGYLADCYSRRRLFTIGTLWWGISTLFIAWSSSFTELLLASCLNGLGLAVIVPVSYSLICDYYYIENRGKAFGWLGFSSVVGAIAGVLFPTIMQHHRFPGDMRPWRVCIYSLGAMVIVLALVVMLVIKNPPRNEAAVGVNMAHLRQIFANKTYLLVMSAGVFSSLSWDVFSFLILWLQCMGMNSTQSGIAFSSCALGAAVGSLFGGFCGDWASKWDPEKGRIIVGQISVFMGIPFAVVFFSEVPREPAYLWLFCVIGFCFGFAISWPQSACNLPILSEVVPHAALGTAYSIDRMIEGGAAAIGSLVLGILAKHYGYKGGDSCGAGSTEQEFKEMSSALAMALLLVMVIPWTCCFFMYFILYFSYPKDRRPDWHFATQ